MKLREYLRSNSMPQCKFAQKVGRSQGYISLVVSGRYILKGKMARQWAEATNFHVTPHDLNAEDYPNPTDGLPPEHQRLLNPA
ncbi:helix-turn-helix transcriptional regulator [Rouxiella sp. T17]|uniref:helix-turn-helix transcriptional regulator n=1 Tax=Rouxiella sp. T17 TaxID=3085684 RepID=UPI002FC5E9B5